MKNKLAKYWNGFLDILDKAVALFFVGVLKAITFLMDAVEYIFKAIVAVPLHRWLRIYLFIAYFRLQNNYFGWNLTPQSDAELITDGIHILLLVLAIWPENKPAQVFNVHNNSDVVGTGTVVTYKPSEKE